MSSQAHPVGDDEKRMKPAKSDISMKVWPASDRLAERKELEG
jgi:hypothetical protein